MSLDGLLRRTRLWLRAGPARGAAPAPRPRGRSRLGLECLEGRLSPAVLTVSTLADSGPGSLRQAITDANAMPGGDAIQFAPAVLGTITLTADLPNLSSNIAVQGPGANRLTVQR